MVISYPNDDDYGIVGVIEEFPEPFRRSAYIYSYVVRHVVMNEPPPRNMCLDKIGLCVQILNTRSRFGN